ncbi:MAG TPA: GNAT family N-acetyltransferase [Holophagaceae bacterium]|nr:GNAT family N-acetyltransferase [Holophagaceae bacterium]
MFALDPFLTSVIVQWQIAGNPLPGDELIRYSRGRLKALLNPITPALRQAADIPGVIELMKRVYRPPHGVEALWKPETLAAHLERFPEGQILLKDGSGRVLADSTGAVLPASLALRPHTWSEATGRGTLSTHDPRNEVFYGVDIAVDPSLQGLGLAKKLYKARLELARTLGCRWFAAGARIPGYHKVAHLLSPETYLKEVAAGLRFDPTLSKQLKLGFRALCVLPGYLADVESLDNAVLIVRAVEA